VLLLVPLRRGAAGRPGSRRGPLRRPVLGRGEGEGGALVTGHSLESLLATLAGLPGVSGRESGVAAAIAGILNASGIEARLDRLGNLYGTILSEQPGPKPKLL